MWVMLAALTGSIEPDLLSWLPLRVCVRLSVQMLPSLSWVLIKTQTNKLENLVNVSREDPPHPLFPAIDPHALFYWLSCETYRRSPLVNSISANSL